MLPSDPSSTKHPAHVEFVVTVTRALIYFVWHKPTMIPILLVPLQSWVIAHRTATSAREPIRICRDAQELYRILRRRSEIIMVHWPSESALYHTNLPQFTFRGHRTSIFWLS